MNENPLKSYWDDRYRENKTGWDIGYPSTPIASYFDQLEDKTVKILIPGAGNAYEAEYLFANGFSQVYVMDISDIPLIKFGERNPDFPKSQLLQADFFKHEEQYDLILEQTFFCSFEPSKENRSNYASHCADLLKTNGKLVGLWFDFPMNPDDIVNRPFGGSKDEYLGYFLPYFLIHTLERCYNSISPRADKELFGIFIKK